jgi:hypothetical protein
MLVSLAKGIFQSTEIHSWHFEGNYMNISILEIINNTCISYSQLHRQICHTYFSWNVRVLCYKPAEGIKLFFFLRVWSFRSHVAAYFFAVAYDAASLDNLIRTFTDKVVDSSSTTLGRKYGRDNPVTESHTTYVRRAKFWILFAFLL